MEPVPLAVSMSALVNLMQFVVIALLLVCVAMMVTLQLAKARSHRRRSAAERGRRRSFCSARNDPQGQGKKIGDNLCGRDDSCDQHVMQSNTSGEVLWPGRKLGDLPREMLRGAVSSLSSCPETHPDGSELCLTLPHAPPRLVSMATRCVLSGRATGKPSEPRHPARLTRISKGPSTADRSITICASRPPPALCQLRPIQSGGRRTSFAAHDRGAELLVQQNEDQHRPRREVRDH